MRIPSYLLFLASHNNMYPGDIKTLDIQARQYCYEHGINIGLH